MFFLMTRYFTRDKTVLSDPLDIVHVVAAVCLLSLRYWENFIDRDIGAIPIQAFKATLRVGRCKTYIFASIWKIGLTLAFAYILIPNMTPMADLFNHIRNESLYLNDSRPSLDYINNIPVDTTTIDTNYTATTFPNFLTTTQAKDFGLDNFNRHFRFKRQAEENDTDSNIFADMYDYYSDLDDYAEVPDGNTSPKQEDDAISDYEGPTTPTDMTDEYTDYDEPNDEYNYDDDEQPSEDYTAETELTNTRLRPRLKRPRINRPPTIMVRRPPPEVPFQDYDYDTYSDYENVPESHSGHHVDEILFRFLPLIVQALSGAVCYYFARVACKLCMQGFGFSFPLTLITPATAAIFCYLCFLQGWTRITIPNIQIGFWKCR